MFVSKGFISARNASAVRCSVRANEGTLYPLAKAFVFINKPTMIIKFEDVESIEFKRYETTGAANLMRNFDLAVTMKTAGTKGETKEISFNLIDRAEYKPLLDFLSSKKITIKNPIVSLFTPSFCFCCYFYFNIFIFIIICTSIFIIIFIFIFIFNFNFNFTDSFCYCYCYFYFYFYFYF